MNVTHFAPNAQALENIPHMLRYWADTIERDSDKGIKTSLAALVIVQDGSNQPTFFIAGTPHSEPHHPLYVSGVFDYCRLQMLSVIESEGSP